MFDERTVMTNLYRHVECLSVEIGQRHLWREDSLSAAADYVASALHSYGYRVERQTYTCYGKRVSNLIVESPGTGEGTIIVGAHYDTVPGTPGADDNASAVAGMLELARLHKEAACDKRVLFVAFANEESPCFGSHNMGSMVYAKALRDRDTSVDVMISLEMIGYFRPERIQRYPLPGMRLLYPDTGDFIAVVGDFRSSRYVFSLKKGIRRHASIRVRSLIAPRHVGGIGLSDNSSFWRHGYRAVMVTDTAFFRNRHYHQETDTIDTLNFETMTQVVKGLHGALREI